MIPINPMIKDISGWLHSGYFDRGDERVDYVAREDTYMCYLRYVGKNTLVSTWQTLFLNQRWFREDGVIWTGTCPFCSSTIRSVYIYESSLRCINCLPLTSRWSKQLAVTQKLRSAISTGALHQVQAFLQGNPRQVFVAMLAMELAGLSPKKLSSPKNMAPWKIHRNRSIRR